MTGGYRNISRSPSDLPSSESTGTLTMSFLLLELRIQRLMCFRLSSKVSMQSECCRLKHTWANVSDPSRLLGEKSCPLVPFAENSAVPTEDGFMTLHSLLLVMLLPMSVSWRCFCSGIKTLRSRSRFVHLGRLPICPRSTSRGSRLCSTSISAIYLFDIHH